MRDILSRTGVGTSEFFFGSDRSPQNLFGSDRDRIGCLNFFLDRIGRLKKNWIGSGSDRLTQKKLDRFGIEC